MNIEVIQQDDTAKALHGSPEVWVQVQSNDIVDWPRVRAAMTEEQAAIIEGRTNGKIIGYHPALIEGGDNNPCSFEDWWILRAEGEQL